MSAPRCVFCGRSEGAEFQIFGPRFEPFGTACVECEATLPKGTEVPERQPYIAGALTNPRLPDGKGGA